MSNYFDPIIKKYIDLLKANNPIIKSYYQGDPIDIAVSLLPAVFITKVSSEVRQFSNAEDQHLVELRATLVVDIRKEFLNTAELADGYSSLYDIIEGREVDYSLKSSSIVDILRSNLSLDLANNLRTNLSNPLRVDYSNTLNQRNKEWFIEAYVDFVAEFQQLR